MRKLIFLLAISLLLIANIILLKPTERLLKKEVIDRITKEYDKVINLFTNSIEILRKGS
ncbi:MAG: hypothetical protein SV062_02230 [Thermodesulfobacteriota bacterium]|nr:hypothetical protein [Thermodesulfobacteriota bacterium]